MSLKKIFIEITSNIESRYNWDNNIVFKNNDLIVFEAKNIQDVNRYSKIYGWDFEKFFPKCFKETQKKVGGVVQIFFFVNKTLDNENPYFVRVLGKHSTYNGRVHIQIAGTPLEKKSFSGDTITEYIIHVAKKLKIKRHKFDNFTFFYYGHEIDELNKYSVKPIVTQKILDTIFEKESTNNTSNDKSTKELLNVKDRGSYYVTESDLDISQEGLNTLNVLDKPWIVKGNFLCYENNFEDMVGFPTHIFGDFWAFGNKFKNLEGAPVFVRGSIDLSDNEGIETSELNEYLKKMEKRSKMVK